MILSAQRAFHPHHVLMLCLIPACAAVSQLPSTAPPPSPTAYGQLSSPPLPFSPKAYGQFEERACRSQTATGQAIIACSNGLKGHSGGKSCLWGVTYLDGVEQPEYTAEVCVRTCTDGALVPDKELKCGAIEEEYNGKVVWRTFGAVPIADRDTLGALYERLIALVSTNSLVDTRKWLKEKILDIVLRDMIPYRQDKAFAAAGSRATIGQFDLFDHFFDPEDPSQSEEAFSPLGVARNQRLSVYESALLERSKGPTARYFMRNPDQLAIDLTHEMVHLLQEGSGYGNLQDEPSELMLGARIRLSELEVYHVTLNMAQFKVLARFKQPIPDVMPARMIKQFYKDWAELNVAERRVLARWAYSLSDPWMRRQMLAAPDSDGGIWGALCTVNTGSGYCHMQD